MTVRHWASAWGLGLALSLFVTSQAAAQNFRPGSYVTPNTDRIRTAARLRNQPNARSPLVGTFPVGSSLMVRSVIFVGGQHWVEVEAESYAYVGDEYLNYSGSVPTARTTLNVRSSATREGALSGGFPRGSQVHLRRGGRFHNDNGRWAEVKAYVRADLVVSDAGRRRVDMEDRVEQEEFEERYRHSGGDGIPLDVMTPEQREAARRRLAGGGALELPSLHRGAVMGTVTGNGVRVRSGPSTRHRILGSVNRGDRLRVLGREGDWVKVTRPRASEAYIHGDFVEVDAAEAAAAELEVAEPDAGGAALDAETRRILGSYVVYPRSGETRLIRSQIRLTHRDGTFTLTRTDMDEFGHRLISSSPATVTRSGRRFQVTASSFSLVRAEGAMQTVGLAGRLGGQAAGDGVTLVEEDAPNGAAQASLARRAEYQIASDGQSVEGSIWLRINRQNGGHPWGDGRGNGVQDREFRERGRRGSITPGPVAAGPAQAGVDAPDAADAPGADPRAGRFRFHDTFFRRQDMSGEFLIEGGAGGRFTVRFRIAQKVVDLAALPREPRQKHTRYESLSSRQFATGTAIVQGSQLLVTNVRYPEDFAQNLSRPTSFRLAFNRSYSEISTDDFRFFGSHTITAARPVDRSRSR